MTPATMRTENLASLLDGTKSLRSNLEMENEQEPRYPFSWNGEEPPRTPQTTQSHNAVVLQSTASQQHYRALQLHDTSSNSTTTFEVYSDYALGAAFLITAAVAAKRIRFNRSTSGTGSTSGSNSSTTASTASTPGAAESAVMTSFYSLILATALMRALYFLIPARWWQPSYTPVAVHAWQTTATASTASTSSSDSEWIGYALAEVTVTTGSVTLFSIFILILVYWADILKKYYNPDSRRTLPMSTFVYLVLLLVTTECLNVILFLCGYYTTEGMILFNAVVLTLTSLICVAQITLFSRKFQNVLKTLGAINQVSTDSQVRRIVWITVTGNVFFLTRAGLEGLFAAYLAVYWYQHGTVARLFSHAWWDTYTIFKYTAELTILALMLHILQSRFSNASPSSRASGTGTSSGTATSRPNASTAGYTKIPDATVDV